MQCTKCKNNIDDDSTFCEFCGEHILIEARMSQNNSLSKFQNGKLPKSVDGPSRNIFAYIQKRKILRNILALAVLVFWIMAIEEEDFLEGTFFTIICTAIFLIVFDTIVKYRRKKLYARK